MISSDAFVEALGKLAPSVEELEGYGLCADEISEIRSSYTASIDKAESKRSRNAILDLLHRYNLSTIEIGDVTFLDSPINIEEGIHFGYSESNILVVNLSNNTVEVRDIANTSYVINYCAASPSRYLECLLIVARCLGGDLDNNTITSVAEKCAKKSGIPESMSYYLTLLGYETD